VAIRDLSGLAIIRLSYGGRVGLVVAVQNGVMEDDEAVPERFRPQLEAIVRRLAAGDFAGVGSDFSPYAGQEGFDLGIWARNYPDTLAALPSHAWDFARALRDRHDQNKWYIDVDLWGIQGRTDLTLSTIVRDTSAGAQVEVRDLHVM
jgi:hypothetical protein